MAYALVGTAGATSATGTSETPAWGTGESRTANNLLVCWAANSSLTPPATSTPGWATAVSKGAAASLSVAIFWKVATGGDVAPTVTGLSITTSVAEFSGNATGSPVDQTASNTATSSPITATAASAAVASGELLLFASASLKSGATNTNTLTNALNNATATTVHSDGATSTSHWAWGYGITTSNAAADSDQFSVATTTNITQMVVAIASFKLPAAAATLLPGQAHGRHPAFRGRPLARGRF